MARSFPGTIHNYINPNSLNFTTFLSVSAWVNFAAQPAANTQMEIVGESDGSDNRNFTLDYRDVAGVKNIELATRIAGGSYGELRAATTLTTGTWHNIVATADWTAVPWTRAIYLDGATLGTSATSATSGTPDTGASMSIGSHQDAGSFLNGALADIALWNVVLTPTEALGLGKGVRPNRIREASLQRWWPLDGLASPEPDMSGNKGNGTINGTLPLAFGPPVMPFTPRWPQNSKVSAAALVIFNAAWAQDKNQIDGVAT